MPRTKDENQTNLGDFFSLIKEEKKKKEEEYQSLLGDLNFVLTELDKISKISNKKSSDIKESKKDIEIKKEKEEIKIEEPKIDINNLFEELVVLKKKEEKKKKKETQEIKAFENWLFNESIEVVDEFVTLNEDKQKISGSLIEVPIKDYEIPIEITFEEENKEEETNEEINNIQNENEDLIDEISNSSEIENGEKIEEENPSVSQVLKTLKSLIKDDNIVGEKNTEIESLKKEVRDLRNLLYQGLRDISVQGGGGEVRLEFMDDIDRASATVNNKFLKYNSTTGKWEGSDASGGGGSLVTLSDVNTSNLANRRLLIYEASTSTFVFVDPSEVMDLADNIDDDIIDYGTF
jgi:hypothetical protein